jgi:hypothetical protein
MLWDQFHPKSSSRSIRMDWHFVCLTGFITSSAWIMIMINHAGHHRHFLYRHLFFAFFVVVLFGAVTAVRRWTEAGASVPRPLRQRSLSAS